MKRTNKKKLDAKTIKIIRIALIVLYACVFVVAAYKIISVYVDYYKSKNATNTVKAEVFQAETDDEGNIEPYEFDFAALQAQNSDAVGWIHMQGDAVAAGDVDIQIDYPIVQTTDNEFYVERSIDGTYSAFGTLFVDYRCEDGLDSSNAVIWGHNMTYPDHAMFGYIDKYADEEFYEKYAYYDVWIGEDYYTYKVFACGTVDVDGFFFQYSFEDDDDYMDWLEECFENLTIYDADIDDFDADTKIITMAACLYPVEEQYRFVVLMYRTN